MSQDKQMKAVSPLLQQVINISSIVGGVGSLIFCIWAYQAGILQSKETLSAFIQQAGIWGPPWLCHYLLSGAPLWGRLCPVCRQQAHL